MRVKTHGQIDVTVDGVVKALFPGQAYDLPGDVASQLVASGQAESLEEKAVEKPQDKAVRPKRNKSAKGD